MRKLVIDVLDSMLKDTNILYFDRCFLCPDGNQSYTNNSFFINIVFRLDTTIFKCAIKKLLLSIFLVAAAYYMSMI